MARFQYDSFSILMYMGVIVGAIRGYESSGVLGLLILAIILGYLGQQIGKSRNLMSKVIFVIVLIFLNKFLRGLLSELFSEVLNLLYL